MMARPSTVVESIGKDVTKTDPYYVVDDAKVNMGLHPHKIVIGSIEGSGPLDPLELPLGMKWVRNWITDRAFMNRVLRSIEM